MNRSVESILRLINLTSAGLLAGSLGFGDVALIPGWEAELPAELTDSAKQRAKLFNAIGPTALATSLTLAIGARNAAPGRRLLDVVSALSLAGVLGTTMLATVPINKKLGTSAPRDYDDQASRSMTRKLARAHTVRTALGVSAFICAVAANVFDRRR